MFISVDLPAPFSPRSACTSPCRKSRSMWSFARTPGNCFVIPRSSSTVAAGMGGAIVVRWPETGRAGRARPSVKPRPCRLAVRVRRALGRSLDRPVRDLLRDGERGCDLLLRDGLVDRAESDTAVPGVEEDVP